MWKQILSTYKVSLLYECSLNIRPILLKVLYSTMSEHVTEIAFTEYFKRNSSCNNDGNDMHVLGLSNVIFNLYIDFFFHLRVFRWVQGMFPIFLVVHSTDLKFEYHLTARDKNY